MLKTKVQIEGKWDGQKITMKELALFPIFIGSLCLIIIGIYIYEAVLHYLNRFYEPLFLLFLTFFLSMAIFVFWIAYILIIESINEGEHAINRFWKRYEKGVLPKFFDSRIEYNKLIPNIVIQFHGGTFHNDILVAIPIKTFEKIETIIKKRQKNHSIKTLENTMKFEFENEEIIELKGDEIVAFDLIDRILKTQTDRIHMMIKLKKQLARGEMKPYDYVKKMTI